jgi:hypothetical protein
MSVMIALEDMANTYSLAVQTSLWKVDVGISALDKTAPYSIRC